jgi:hypothetical protein
MFDTPAPRVRITLKAIHLYRNDGSFDVMAVVRHLIGKRLSIGLGNDIEPIYLEDG